MLPGVKGLILCSLGFIECCSARWVYETKGAVSGKVRESQLILVLVSLRLWFWSLVALLYKHSSEAEAGLVASVYKGVECFQVFTR